MLASVLDSFPQTTITVSRRGAPYVNDGVVQPGPNTSLTMIAVVTPVTGRELERLPEGLRTRQPRRFFTVDALRTADDRSRFAADVVTIGDQEYQIERVSDWSDHGYYESIGVRLENS